MRTALLFSLTLVVASAAAAGKPVRNPFWPIGYEGSREVISADYRPTPVEKKVEATAAAAQPPPAAAQGAPAVAQAKKEAARETVRPATDAEWNAAKKQIRVGGLIRAKMPDGTERANVILDGKPYGDGDLKSVSFGGRRYVWRVSGLEGGDRPRLQLKRMKDISETNGKEVAK